MHCCDIVRSGQTLPSRLPDEWGRVIQTQRERTGSLPKPNISQAFASLNQDLKDTFENHSPETERKNSIVTYEEKRQKNYEVCIFIIVFFSWKQKPMCSLLGWI